MNGTTTAPTGGGAEALGDIARRFQKAAPACDYWTLRLIDETHEGLAVRDDVPSPAASAAAAAP
jgi:hypothetical protein